MQKTAYALIVTVITIIALVYGKTLLIPLIFALLIWILIRGVRMVIDKNDWIRKFVPSWLKNLLTATLFFFVLVLISKVLMLSVTNLGSSYKTYEDNLRNSSIEINQVFNINVSKLLLDKSSSLDFSSILGTLFQSFSDILGSTLMIFLYALFILLEEAHFGRKMKLVFSKEGEYERFSAVLLAIEKSVTRYLGFKTLVSILTGFLSYIALFYIGVDSPLFWSFLIFMFNYIPTIGSLVGTFFPALFCILQFGEFSQCFTVLGVVGLIQLFIGNIVEPKVMGNSLNISSLVAIMALALWGSLWGITGMMLSIPITVILIIILSQIEQTKGIAILLSDKGIGE